MVINYKTLTKDILPLLTKELLEDLLKNIQPVPLKKALFKMSVGEFGELVEDEETYIAGLLKQRKALKAFGMLKQYRNEMKVLEGFMKMYDYNRTQEERNAAVGIKFPNLSQRMLIDCVRWFHLRTTEEAEKITVSEWLLFWQDEASSALYQRNFQKLMEQKYQKKGKRK